MRICPSLLAADFACLSAEIDPLESMGINHIHIDMMDGHFVPNIAIGLPVVESLRAHYPEMELDVHLELEKPEVLIDQLIEIGVNYIGVQAEVNPDLGFLRERMYGTGIKLGLTIAPDTPVEAILDHVNQIDYLIALSVPPGFGGQTFREEVLDKIVEMRRKFSGPIQVDGGINRDNIVRARDAGADWFVVGSAIFRAPDSVAAAHDLLAALNRTSGDDKNLSP